MKIDTEKLIEALRRYAPELAASLPAAGEAETDDGEITVTASYDEEHDMVSLQFSAARRLALNRYLSGFTRVEGDGLEFLAFGHHGTNGEGAGDITGSLSRTDIRRLYGGETLLALVMGSRRQQGGALVRIPS